MRQSPQKRERENAMTQSKDRQNETLMTSRWEERKIREERIQCKRRKQCCDMRVMPMESDGKQFSRPFFSSSADAVMQVQSIATATEIERRPANIETYSAFHACDRKFTVTPLGTD